jgi:hypothetical protein
MLLPLRAQSLDLVTVVGQATQLDSTNREAFINLTPRPSERKIFISADNVKNGKSLGAINRPIPEKMAMLLLDSFKNLDSPKKLIGISPAKLNGYLNMISFTLLPEYFPKGLTIHCYRHIVASAVIMADPSGYAVAAQLLHDTIAQVEKTYGFKRQDQHVQAYYDSSYMKSAWV